MAQTKIGSKQKELDDLNAKWDALELPLKREATQAVFGEGSADAEIVIIGEAPGKQEDIQGKPFVGASGKFLTQLIESIGLTRDKVFIANMIKHRPPSNRDPSPEELAAYHPWLDQQIEIINPKVIVTLGRFSMMHFLGDAFTISQAHGQPKRDKAGLLIMPMYHPAAALYRGDLRPVLMADFAKLPKVIKMIEQDKAVVLESVDRHA